MNRYFLHTKANVTHLHPFVIVNVCVSRVYGSGQCVEVSHQGKVKCVNSQAFSLPDVMSNSSPKTFHEKTLNDQCGGRVSVGRHLSLETMW